MMQRWYDPINGVWMRVIPNLGMSFAEYTAAMDEMVREVVERSPAFSEFVFQQAKRLIDAQANDATVS